MVPEKCSGALPSRTAHEARLTSRASATTRPPAGRRGGTRRRTSSRRGRPLEVPLVTQQTASATAATGAGHVQRALGPALGWGREAAMKATVAPGHEVEEAGVGPVVDRGVRAGVEQQRHQGRREPDRRPRSASAPPAPATPAQAQETQHEGPHHVELLLDRQGPRVLEGRRRGELGEVGLVGVDGVPVAHVEQASRWRRRAGRTGR